MEIRLMNSNDFLEVKELLKEEYLFHYQNRPDIYKLIHEINEKSYQECLSDYNYVAIVNNEIVGFLIASKKNTMENEFLKSQKMLFIEEIYIKKEFQHQGIGQTLMNTILEIAKKELYDCIECNVWEFNKEAQEFYQKIGMKPKNHRYERRI